MKKNLSIILNCFVAIGFSSCSVYYTTSQVDNSLKSSINQANSSIGNLEYQLTMLESKYNEVHCDNKPESVLKADQMFLEVKSDMAQVNKQKSELNQEYVDFQNYTKGKDKIVSGTPEYEKLKSTRSNMKSKMEDLQGKCNQVVQKSQNVSNYITKNVVPTIQIVNVADYQSMFDKAIGGLNKEYIKLTDNFNSFQSDAQKYISANKNKDATKIAKIESELNLVNKEMSLVNEVKNEFTVAYNNFTKSTLGKKTINSCSKEWTIVENAQTSIQASENKLALHIRNIEQSAKVIQSLIQ